MNIRTTVRTLAVVALLTMTVVSVSAGQADARPRGPRPTDGLTSVDIISPCTIQGSAVGEPQHDQVFYLAGDTITVDGIDYVCEAYGRWIAL